MKTVARKRKHQEASFDEIMHYIRSMRTNLSSFEREVSRIALEAARLSADITNSMKVGNELMPTKAQLEAVSKLGEWQPDVEDLRNQLASFDADLLLGKMLQEPSTGDFVDPDEASPNAKSFSILKVLKALER